MISAIFGAGKPKQSQPRTEPIQNQEETPAPTEIQDETKKPEPEVTDKKAAAGDDIVVVHNDEEHLAAPPPPYEEDPGAKGLHFAWFNDSKPEKKPENTKM